MHMDKENTVLVPIASSLMEAQPVALLLQTLPTLFNPTAVGAGQGLAVHPLLIAALLLGQRWWAIFVSSQTGKTARSLQADLRYLLGLLAGLALMLGIIVWTDGLNGGSLLMGTVLVIWSWWRGMQWTRPEEIDDQLITTFKVGFVVLIALLLFAMLRSYEPLIFGQLLSSLALSLPLFFLSGLIALSFTRLSSMRRENKQSVTGSRLDSSRTWMTVLSILWTALVGLSIALELFSFRFLQAIFQPILYSVGWGIGALLYLLNLLLRWLFSWLPAPSASKFATPTSTPQPDNQPNMLNLDRKIETSPTVLLIAQIVLIVLLVAVLALIVWLILKRRRSVMEDDGEREEREGLGISTLFKREQPARQSLEPAFALEGLDPDSARAHYRDLLQTMATERARLSKLAGETPAEYERRLLLHLQEHNAEPEDHPQVLATLTEAYEQERYGGKPTQNETRSYLGTWVPGLIKRLKS
jgi:hypothetical protein